MNNILCRQIKGIGQKELRIGMVTSDYADFEESVCASCFSFEGTAADTPRVTAVFGNAPIKVLSGRISVLGAPMSEHAAAAAAAAVGLPLLSRIRML